MVLKNFPALENALGDVMGFVEEELELHECPFKTIVSISVAIEEIFVNVARYAYADKGGGGDVSLSIDVDDALRTATLEITDGGQAFNPLEMPDPDITLSAEDRAIGGLGIFITKKTMDSLSYRYENGKNILTMMKKI